MTESDRRRAEEILDEARAQWRYSAGLVRLLEEAVRLADAHGEAQLRWDARNELVTAATFAGFPEVAFMAFGWMLGRCDEEPERFRERDVLWEYKWITGSLHRFPGIDRERIDRTIDDMVRRYERCGMNLRPVHDLRRQLAVAMGRFDEAKEHDVRAVETPRDWGADCRACETANRVEYVLFAQGDPRAAIELAEPLLDGSMRCATVPRSTLGLLLIPHLQLGLQGDAARYHRRGMSLLQGDGREGDVIGNHLGFLAVTGNHARGLGLFARRFSEAIETRDMERRFGLYAGALLLLLKVAQRARKKTRKLALPKVFPLWREDRTYELDALVGWLREELRGLAQSFDRRNGTDWFARRVDEVEELSALDAPLKL